MSLLRSWVKCPDGEIIEVATHTDYLQSSFMKVCLELMLSEDNDLDQVKDCKLKGKIILDLLKDQKGQDVYTYGVSSSKEVA